MSQISRAAARRLLIATVVAGGINCCFGASAVHADDARAVLKAMTDFIGAQQSISATLDSDIEVLTTDLQKIQFTNSGRVQMVRPDKFRAARLGGYSDIELVFNGKTLSLLGKVENAYVSLERPGNFDQLVAGLREQLGVAIPAADLLVSHSFDQLMTGVIESKHIGRGVIDGVECEHLAFRTHDIDWQIWIEVGPRPIPRKYVITSKTVTGAPQYTLRVKQFGTDPIPADAFAFSAPAGAKSVSIAELQNIDEVPQGTVAGEKK